MTNADLRITYLTAGAAGMYCGSCMHDNTLARALSKLGVDVQLVPTYTPIRTDEENISVDRVFLGGINVYLQQRISLFRHVPAAASRFLNHPRLVRWMTSFSRHPKPKLLGEMTVSMLRGSAGFQRNEVKRLCDWIARSSRPQLVNFSNIMIAGCVPELRAKLDVPIVVTLQGDDIFLDSLPGNYRDQALSQIRQLVSGIDAFLVFSRFYADFMEDYFSIPREKLQIVPLGIDVADLQRIHRPSNNSHGSFTVGYLARLAPEKGFHVLVDAFISLRRRRKDVRMVAAGWLGEEHQAYVDQQFAKVRDAGFSDDFRYLGSVDREGKLTFLSEIDVLSVPTTYRDPKGLFVLEAIAAGVPVVQPDHGAFPEIIRDVGGGELTTPNNADHLADALDRLLSNRESLRRLGQSGRQAVCDRRDAATMARETVSVYRAAIENHAALKVT